jgi:hypothetical protein
MRPYGPPVSVPKLFAMLIALAVLIAPSATYAAMPAAMAAHHGMQMMEMGHCESPPGDSHGKAPVKSCCMSMCMAVAITPDAPVSSVEPKHISTYFAVPTSWHGYLSEIATPPPRLA